MHSAIRRNETSGDPEGSTHGRMEILFYALAVLLTTTAIVSCFPLFHVTNNWAENTLMFVPGLMAVAFRLRNHEGFRSVGWGAGPAVYWLWAILLPIIVLAIVLPLSIRLGYAAMAPLSTAHGRLLTHPVKILENLLLYTAISLPLAFGEEFGWRGYAQGKLVREFGLLKGLLLLGLLWGFWHTPIYYVMGDSPAHPILGPFVMTPIDNILAVVPMAWLYLKSRSIWIPTLTHAFADVLWGFSDLLFPKSHEMQSWALLQTAQLILSIILLMNLKSKREDAHITADQASPFPAVGT
jgi:membrane protease YdiL (CAAX protease family)